MEKKYSYFIFKNVRGYLKSQTDADIKKIITTNPDDLFQYSVKNLKNSKRARLSIIKVNNKKYFLKRYNVKNITHKIRRVFSPSPAKNIWGKNLHFSKKGFATSNLIAAVDLGKGFSYRGSYALYDFIDGAEKSIKTIKRCYQNESDRPKLLKKFSELIWQMHQKGIYHGDAKKTNFIWTEKNSRISIIIIDLDSTKFLKKIKDRQRISDLKNLASSLAFWDSRINITEKLLDAYIKYHPPWVKKRNLLLKKINKEAYKQLKHRKKRQNRRNFYPEPTKRS